ncbi:class I SAM-dependent methyltransferase [Paractinoplanes atraurantiacus]|uniref:Methyltransferase domain-containing protein n=1 Tax=Paractinoplanes atraurantiacus TaxID=1036182 RepID=A0A285ISL8_9ACTN|nr:class I SAM-dependent methyltransferase [Actinoplanes atraurantiacus]SNY49941.1 Methyltransferase domain-containing protein [Actinoplanes atraurantiacus]
MTRPPGNYGIDAPRLIAVPVILIVAGLLQAVLQRSVWPLIGVVLIAACCALGFYASRAGKFVVWSRLLDGLGLRGDEQILDLGCGRGALLISAALRVPQGRAVGVDLWRADQSGNGPEATMSNASAAGVTGRVDLRTADITALPFPDAAFDVVISNVVIHNLKAAADRDKAIDEAVRVLRPGGRLLVADLRHTRQYERRLEHSALTEIARRDLGWRQWWSGPWLPTHLVSARKPL